MNFELEYREKGEKKIKIFDIDFVSNSIIERHNKIVATATDVQIKWDKMGDNASTMVALLKEKEEGYKDKINELKAENDKFAEIIKATGASDYFQNRFELIKDLLIQNGVKEEKFLDIEFWNNCVDSTEMMKLVVHIIQKDMPKKKAG